MSYTVFPEEIDTFASPNGPIRAIIALESYVGIKGSEDQDSLTYMINHSVRGPTGPAGVTSVTTVDESPYVAKGTSGMYLIDATASQISFTLPAPFAIGTWFIKKIDPTTNTVIVTTPSGTIDGESAVELTEQYQAIQITSNGNSYFIF